jgi:hypothetical protein
MRVWRGCSLPMGLFEASFGKGHRLCHVTTSAKPEPVAPSHRPAPAPAMAGASHPPGRALASGGMGISGSCRGRRDWAGKRDAFSDPPRVPVYPQVCGAAKPLPTIGPVGRPVGEPPRGSIVTS